MKKLLVILLLLLMVTPVYAGNQNAMSVIARKKAGGGATDYSDILFYFNCDSDTTGTSPQKGSGTITIDANILLNTTDKIVGTGCLDQNNDGYDNWLWTATSNVDFASGRIGFYFNPQELNTGNCIHSVGDDLIFRYTGGNQALTFLGTTTNITTGMSIGNWYFLEFKTVGTTCTMYVDGVSKGSATGTGSVNDTVMYMGATDGNAWDQLWDQVITTNDPDRDLNAVKSVTDFS